MTPIKLTLGQKRLLYEAYRRNDMADSCDRISSLQDRWLGLGTRTTYKPVLEAKGGALMAWVSTPPPRCMGWLHLTERGVKALKQHEEEFKEALATLKTNKNYTQSYKAHYVLVP